MPTISTITSDRSELTFIPAEVSGRIRRTGSPLRIPVDSERSLVVLDYAAYQQLLDLVGKKELVSGIYEGLLDAA